MRKYRQEISDAGELEQILTGNTICRVAMLDRGRPYLLPFNYGYHQGSLYIHCAREGRKLDILRKDPGVCFEVEDQVGIIQGDTACKWSTRYRSIVGEAVAEILEEPHELRSGLEHIMRAHGAPELNDFPDSLLKRMLIIRLDINSMSGKRSSNWDPVTKEG